MPVSLNSTTKPLSVHNSCRCLVQNRGCIHFTPVLLIKEARRNSVLKPDTHNSQGGTPARIRTVPRVTTLPRLLQGIISQEGMSVNTHNHSRAYPCERATGIIWTTTTHVWQKRAPRGPMKCPWWKHNRGPTANKRHPCPEPTHLHVPTNKTTRRQCNA